MTDDDDLDSVPVRKAPDPSTPMGRIEGHDQSKYARLWGIDLDTPADDDYPGGQADFELTIKLMWCDWAEARGSFLDNTRREIDLEDFAAAWRPPTMSEMIEEEIERREEEARRRRDQDPEVRH
jgi:hypothetical protein